MLMSASTAIKRILTGLRPLSGAAGVLCAAADVASSTGAKLSLLRVIEGYRELSESRLALVSATQGQLRELARDVPPSLIDGLRR
jgi:hypothetical protein